MKLHRQSSTSLVDDVVVQLRGLVSQQKLAAGARLPNEGELTKRFGVSRSVLREAIGRLQTVGLLDVQHGRGTFVASGTVLLGSAQLLRSALTIAPHELMKFHEFRAVIECYAARRIAEIATETDLVELEQLCNEIDREDQDYLASIHADFAFHAKVVERTANEPMQNVFKVLQEFIMASMVNTTPQPRNIDYSRKIHRDLLDAIRSRDPKIAGAEIDRHMELSRVALQALGERQQRDQ
jgi:GntR family transcriptional repressor for pyruvate dehydrogenase complex